MTRIGRKPQGAALVAPLPGSAHAKRRLTLFLETLSGHCRVQDACAELGIGPSRFFAQRAAWLQESLALLEPRVPGRPVKPAAEVSPEEVRALRQRVGELETRSAAVQAQVELAHLLPHLRRRLAPGKKTT
jgi:transposase-like protein